MRLWTEVREVLKDIQFAWRLARMRRRQAERRAIAKEQREVALEQQRLARQQAAINSVDRFIDSPLQVFEYGVYPWAGTASTAPDNLGRTKTTPCPVCLAGKRTYDPGTDSEWAPSETGS